MGTILKIDGEPVEMNPFVSKIVKNTLVAIVNSLELPKTDWKTLDVTITK